MKTITAILGSVLILCSFGLAQTQTKDEKKTLSQVVDSATQRLERDFVPAAEAMPRINTASRQRTESSRVFVHSLNRSSIMPLPTTWSRP